MVYQYEEESEVFKDRNHHMKEKVGLFVAVHLLSGVPCPRQFISSCFCEQLFSLHMQNYHLKVEQTGHYKTLVRKAKEHKEELEGRECVEKDRVEEALKEKLQFTKWAEHNLIGEGLDGLQSCMVYHFKVEMFSCHSSSESDL